MCIYPPVLCMLTTPYLLSHLRNLVSYLTRLGRIGTALWRINELLPELMILDLGQPLQFYGDQDPCRIVGPLPLDAGRTTGH